ncbi:hypothetical protein QBZ16_001111 [Prototheca wickerhamii]|uniref:Rab-GAP TBC domain-containing protein n=1 Tax=Prototheca wickerhamii TaxID=3111 RepID=A0AAD9IFI2_PROWI|nr:hypothetical protein QBZ16_001111 [Prototheca wickerhamii]
MDPAGSREAHRGGRCSSDPEDEAEAVVRDRHVIGCDIDRSLWAFTQGWTEAARQEKREELRALILAVLRRNPGTWYYQGLHDVASVFLFTVGPSMAERLLGHLLCCHLRDATRPDLGAITQILCIVYPLLEVCDPELHDFLISLDEPALETPYFALSWLLTWFAHDVPDLDSIARLFDLFLASHPLMPLYLAAVAIKSNRDCILACGEDGPAVYAALKTMKILRGGRAQADALACQAAALFRARPPAALRHVDLFQAVAPDAFLQGGAWRVPPLPVRQSEQGIRASVRALRAVPGAVLGPAAPGTGGFDPRRRVALLSTVTALAAVGAAFLLSQTQT